jgi:predicted 3-demethylubiquinone-9 3-methyltransferase (glyoxalase superfamily)
MTAMQRFQKITPCLWFDDQAEAAAKFYCSIFDHSKITGLTTTARSASNSTASRKAR